MLTTRATRSSRRAAAAAAATISTSSSSSAAAASASSSSSRKRSDPPTSTTSSSLFDDDTEASDSEHEYDGGDINAADGDRNISSDDDEDDESVAMMSVSSERMMVENAERALQEASKVRAQRAKKRRIESFRRNHPPFEMLPPEVVGQVLLYVDNPHTIYELTKMSKHLRGVILSRPDIVVRAAVFGGGKAKDAITQVVTQVSRQSIQVPSVSRVLRLVNAKRCELGEQCYAYNMVTKMSADMKKNGRRLFGMSMCQLCLKGYSAQLIPHHSHFAANNSRVCAADGNRLLCSTQVEAVTGTPIGPFFSGIKVKQIECSYAQPEEKKKELEKLLAVVDENTPDEDKTRREAFVAAHSDAQAGFDAFAQAKVQVTVDRRRKKFEARAAKKLENCQAVYARVAEGLEGYPHKSVVLECEWNESGVCEFRLTLSNLILGRLIAAPSSASQKKVEEKVQEIREAFDLLHANGFMAANYLSFLKNQDARHLKAMYQYCREKKPCTDLLKDDAADHQFLNLVRGGRRAEALYRTMGYNDQKDAFVLQVLTEFNHLNRPLHEESAKQIWDRTAGQQPIMIGTPLGVFAAKYDHRRKQYRTLTKGMKKYLRSEGAVKFLAETGPPPRHPNQTFTRRDAVNTTYTNLEAVGHMLSDPRNFAATTAHHRRIFANPLAYGYPPNPN